MSRPIPDRHTTELRAAEAKQNRGRSAETPTQIPLRGWKDIAIRSYQEVNNNNIFLVAGGVTYALLLALFPALAALVAVYGLLFDPNQVEQQVEQPVGGAAGPVDGDGQCAASQSG